jgi:hypothetical protein
MPRAQELRIVLLKNALHQLQENAFLKTLQPHLLIIITNLYLSSNSVYVRQVSSMGSVSSPPLLLGGTMQSRQYVSGIGDGHGATAASNVVERDRSAVNVFHQNHMFTYSIPRANC